MIIIPQEDAMTIDNFDSDKYADQLREQGYRDDAIPDLIEKKKASLQKDESDFEYVMKLEEVGRDSNHIIVAGIASNGSLDWDDESIDLDSLRTSWDNYMKNPVLRYMHGKDQRHPGAIGRVIPEYVMDNGKTLKTEFRDGKPFIVAKLSNAPDVENIRVKVQEGVLKGFSIGGRANRVAEFCHKLGKDVNRIFIKRLSEISIVDLPANKEGFFEIIKGCVGNNCSCDIYNNENYDGIDMEFPENDISKNIQIDKLEDKMTENIEMEMSELEEFVKGTVSKMIAEQDTLEKVEGYDAAIKQIQDLKARIAELEAKVTAQAATLKAQPQKAMKSETTEIEDGIEKTETVEKTETIVVEDPRIAELEAKVTELTESPLYKSEQTEVVEKTEVAQTSHLINVIKANYGGN